MSLPFYSPSWELLGSSKSKGHAGGKAGKEGNVIVGKLGKLIDGMGILGNCKLIDKPNSKLGRGIVGRDIVGKLGKLMEGIGILGNCKLIEILIDGRDIEGNDIVGKLGRLIDGIGMLGIVGNEKEHRDI